MPGVQAPAQGAANAPVPAASALHTALSLFTQDGPSSTQASSQVPQAAAPKQENEHTASTGGSLPNMASIDLQTLTAALQAGASLTLSQPGTDGQVQILPALAQHQRPQAAQGGPLAFVQFPILNNAAQP